MKALERWSMAGTYDQSRPSIPEPVRREVMVEANHKCTIPNCNNVYLDIHHINENREDNRPANLIVLCTEHHRMAHDKKIDRLALAMYKANLRKEVSSSQYVRSSESDRAYRFKEELSRVLTFNNEGEVMYILTGAGYDFPIEIYNKAKRFIENSHYYEQSLRSHDPELRATQDQLVQLLAQVTALIDSPRYRPLAFDYRYIPLARPGTKEYDKEIADQIKLVDDLLRKIFHLLSEVSNYSSIRL